jgi:hypothetical protein
MILHCCTTLYSRMIRLLLKHNSCERVAHNGSWLACPEHCRLREPARAVRSEETVPHGLAAKREC